MCVWGVPLQAACGLSIFIHASFDLPNVSVVMVNIHIVDKTVVYINYIHSWSANYIHCPISLFWPLIDWGCNCIQTVQCVSINTGCVGGGEHTAWSTWFEFQVSGWKVEFVKKLIAEQSTFEILLKSSACVRACVSIYVRTIQNRRKFIVSGFELCGHT